MEWRVSMQDLESRVRRLESQNHNLRRVVLCAAILAAAALALPRAVAKKPAPVLEVKELLILGEDGTPATRITATGLSTKGAIAATSVVAGGLTVAGETRQAVIEPNSIRLEAQVSGGSFGKGALRRMVELSHKPNGLDLNSVVVYDRHGAESLSLSDDLKSSVPSIRAGKILLGYLADSEGRRPKPYLTLMGPGSAQSKCMVLPQTCAPER
jgi:hypothetical protein